MTRRPMRPGDWVMVDMGKTHAVKKISIDFAGSPSDYARGCTAYLSGAGKCWQKVAELSQSDCEARQKDGILGIEVKPTDARFVKVVQTGKHDAYLWNVFELNIYE